MLESMNMYGYYGAAGGVTGENVGSANCIRRKMKYCEYKKRYPECKNLGDYDKIQKTITVLIPEEYTERANFGNKYRMKTFKFKYAPKREEYTDVFECSAKNYENALRNAKKWAKDEGVEIIGDDPNWNNHR